MRRVRMLLALAALVPLASVFGATTAGWAMREGMGCGMMERSEAMKEGCPWMEEMGWCPWVEEKEPEVEGAPGAAAEVGLSAEQKEKMAAIEREYGEKREILEGELGAKREEWERERAKEKKDFHRITALGREVTALRREIRQIKQEKREKLAQLKGN